LERKNQKKETGQRKEDSGEKRMINPKSSLERQRGKGYPDHTFGGLGDKALTKRLKSKSDDVLG